MRDITAVAEQLRLARQARKKFMSLWTLEQNLIHPGLDRMAADVEAAAPLIGADNSTASLQTEPDHDDE